MNPERRLRIGLQRLHSSGVSWRNIGKMIGESGGQTWFLAHGPTQIDDERAEEIMRELPRHLWKTTVQQEASVLAEIRDNHVGMKKAIKSRYLALQLSIEERMIRSCVNSLRKQGFPICSSVGKHSGFYWPASRKEYEAFKDAAVDPYVAMREAYVQYRNKKIQE